MPSIFAVNDSMLTRLVDRDDATQDFRMEYNVGGEYEYRDAEYEYERSWSQSHSVQRSRACGFGSNRKINSPGLLTGTVLTLKP